MTAPMNGIFLQREGLNMSDHSKAFDFYVGRIESVPNYGFVSGHNLLNVIHRCAFFDSDLSYNEFCDILDRINACHRKLMEVNYNEGWN